MEAREYCRHLFDKTTDGTIHTIKLDKNKGIKVYKSEIKGLRDFVEEFENEIDVYMSTNTTYNGIRQVKNIRQFRALYQDIDIVNVGFTKEETVYLIFILAIEGKIPEPTMIIDSGRGIHPYWRIENAPYGALHTWQELQDYIYYQLKSIGADKKALDGARVLRLPGTINSKDNSECKILYINNDITYSMYELREQYLQYKPKQLQFQEAKTSVKKTKVISNKFFNSYSLHMARIEDIETLCKLRNYNMQGYRNMILHCYAYWKGIYTRNIEELEIDVIELNNSFTEPMKETEVKAILRCVPKSIDKFLEYEQGIRSGEDKRVTKGMRDKAGYWYKNETLIDRLDITRAEQRHLKTIIGTEEKYFRNNERRKIVRRNENGLTKKQQELKNEEVQVKEYRKQGLSMKKIADKMGISKAKVVKLANL